MSLLLQLSDTHILPPGKLLYDSIDTAAHLRITVNNILRMRPQPDLVVVTGDLVDGGDRQSYEHFLRLIEPLPMPVFVTPGNHDRPDVMQQVFATKGCFPADDTSYQYAIDQFPFRLLALNSRDEGTELPGFGSERLAWLEQQLNQSDQPTLIAMHHPPMKTGIELIDMGGSEWYLGIQRLLNGFNHVKLLICGHCHTDLCGRISGVPVYMAPATSHQLIGSRGINIAPSAQLLPGIPVLHQYVDEEFRSGSHPWPENIEEDRIDAISGISWEQLKKNMMGSRS